jgi:hypothetical protein
MHTPPPESRTSIEVTADARDALLAHLTREPGRSPYIRIHVGRG